MKYMSNRKVMTIHLITGLIKMILLYKMSYFPKLYSKKTKEKLNHIYLITQQNLS